MSFLAFESVEYQNRKIIQDEKKKRKRNIRFTEKVYLLSLSDLNVSQSIRKLGCRNCFSTEMFEIAKLVSPLEYMFLIA